MQDIPLETAALEWSGLERYRVADDAMLRNRSLADEYAKVESVIDAEHITVLYYSDVAGMSFVLNKFNLRCVLIIPLI
jgi:hypothetical protein